MLDRQPRHAQPEWCPATQGQTPSQRGGSIVAIVAGGSTFRQENTAYAGSSRCTSSPPPPLRRLALPPANRGQASHERHQSRPEPVRVAISRDKHTEDDEQADIHTKHHPALPHARRPPSPAVTLRREPVAGFRGWLFLAHSTPCFLNHANNFAQPSLASASR